MHCSPNICPHYKSPESAFLFYDGFLSLKICSSESRSDAKVELINRKESSLEA